MSASLRLLFLLLSLHLVPHDSRTVHLVKTIDNVNNTSARKGLTCPEEEAEHRKISATILLVLAGLGCLANMVVMIIIMIKKRVRRWSLGLIFHQCIVDCSRACILIPLGRSLLECQPVLKCSLLETAFLLLATVSTVSIRLVDDVLFCHKKHNQTNNISLSPSVTMSTNFSKSKHTIHELKPNNLKEICSV